MTYSTKAFVSIVLLLFLSACATHNAQFAANNKTTKPFTNEKEIEHSFYLIGDAGNAPIGTTTTALKAFKAALKKAPENSTAIFLGDNIYPNGFPKKEHKDIAFVKHQMRVQIAAVSDFKGETLFLPGNHDWYSGLKGLKRQEKYIENAIGKNTFLPEDGCPIAKIHVSDEIELILIDSEWYITNWDRHPTINDDCEIKTRTRFFDEFASLIKKARGKTTIIAMHHPMFTNGPHGGKYSFGSHLTPIPVLGTLKNIIRKTAGISSTDLQHKRYSELKKRLVTLAQHNEKVVFISGHDHSLQYLVQDNLRQIISGSGSKVSATRNTGGGQFSYGHSGYVRLDVFKNGASHVRFYSATDNKIVFQTAVLPPNKKEITTLYPAQFPEKVSASIYTEAETDKSKFHSFLWGERYRNYYSTKVSAPTVDLDTLYGGLKPVRKGGGNQSKSLRLEDKNGAQYVMRALRKQALQYLQAVLFKDRYIEGQFDDTKTACQSCQTRRQAEVCCY